jgi:hypothetical protein
MVLIEEQRAWLIFEIFVGNRGIVSLYALFACCIEKMS